MQFRTWWSQGVRVDRRWTVGCAAALGLGVGGWLVYATLQPALRDYLQKVDFDQSSAQTIGAFSTHQVGWFLLFFLLAAGLLGLVLSGVFAGSRARWGGALLGLLLVIDLGRANLPWIIYWNYQQQYATNDVLRFLQQEPYEHRVALVPFRTSPESALLDAVYHVEWAQHQFPYYGIQSLDIVALPRMPKDLAAFESAFFAPDGRTVGRLARRWQLTNTRYLLAPTALLQSLNDQLDPVQQRFHILRQFDLVPAQKDFGSAAVTFFGAPRGAALDAVTAVFNTNGTYAIVEFAGALPRAKLYTHWLVSTNESATLERLGSPDFDPETTVLVHHPSLPISRATETISGGPNTNPGNGGTVEFVSYASKEILLQTRADVGSVLLLNDRFDPQWSVTVDDKPATLLRCNYLMRGVQLDPGPHRVRFRFQIPIGRPVARLEIEPDTQAVSFVFNIPTGLPSKITLAAYGIGLMLIVVLGLRRRRGREKIGQK